MYRNIIFDLYGTLIDLRTDEGNPAFWETLSLFLSYNGAPYESSELKEQYRRVVAQRLAENKQTKYPDTKIILALQQLYAQKGVSASDELLSHTVRLFRAASTEYLRLYPGVKELLQALRAEGKNLYILSNGQREFSVPELRYLGIFESFQALYSSADYGVCKPDVQFYNCLLKKEMLKAEDCLFVGNDDSTDILGAKAAGMDSVYLHSNQSRKVTHTEATYEIWDGDVSKVLPYAFR